MATDPHEITLAEAAQLTANYRTLPVATLVAALQGMKAQSLPLLSIQHLINQPNVAGVRIYFGADLLPPAFKLILVATDAVGNDIKNGVIIDRFAVCPPICGVANELNGN